VTSVDGPKGREYWERADRVLPGGGIYLSRSARFAGEGIQPGFIAWAEGCRLTDVDGRSYIDFLCANGPNLLGYRHPEVDEAARQQLQRADATSYFPPALVEFAERLVERTPGMAWAVPAKNGSDVVALAARVARAETGRDTLLLFERAYHGFDPEWVPGGVGVPEAHRSSIVRVPWNDVERLDRIAVDGGTDLAAIVMNPFDQNPGLDTVPASTEFIERIGVVRRSSGALLILDDVRAGFRLHPEGSHLALGIEPDLICFGKALGNGYAIAAVLGTEALRGAARKLLFTSTAVFGAVSLSAASKTLEIYDRDRAFERLLRAGERLRAGFLDAARETGHSIRYSGPPTMPTLLFDDDPQRERCRHFAREAALRGALFHPNLNWFLSAAHDDATIDEAIEIARAAFASVPTGRA
jgi:glutamate-1-semialdehyde 2,1-aminomutase